MAKKLSQMTSGMPQMEAAFEGWTVKLTGYRVTQSVVNGFTQDLETSFSFHGTVQPLSATAISLKPEGQREWEWLQIHVPNGQPKLKQNDRIRYNGKRFKVMPSKDYSLNNYMEYHCIEDYQNA